MSNELDSKLNEKNDVVENCLRCKTSQATITSRAEPLCDACFLRFLQQKHRRQLEDYKVSYSANKTRPQVLLALTREQSSLCLLDMTVSLIRSQREAHRGRQGFDLTAAIISTSYTSKKDQVYLSLLRSRYSECRFLQFDLDALLKTPDLVSPVMIKNQTTQCRQSISFSEYLQDMKSKSSQQDLLAILTNLVLKNYTCKALGCGTILYHHTMTQLAQEAISLTAKGRGDSISSALGDNVDTETGVAVIYPLRDVLTSDVNLYCQIRDLIVEEFVDLLISDVAVSASAPTRSLSIDELVANYFKQVEVSHPSVVSTVVKTISKLSSPTNHESVMCLICGEPSNLQKENEWLQSIASGEKIIQGQLCYGCRVMCKDFAQDSIVWPRRNPESRVLNEYLLLSEGE